MSLSPVFGVDVSLLFGVLEVGDRLVDSRREIVAERAEVMGFLAIEPGRLKGCVLSELASEKEATRGGQFGGSRISPYLSNPTAPHNAALRVASEPARPLRFIRPARPMCKTPSPTVAVHKHPRFGGARE